MVDKNVWEVLPGEIRKPGIQHLVITALFIGVGAVVGMTGASASVGFGVTFFWPAIAIQIVGGIWYGIWGGAIAAGIFPIISNMVAGTPPIVSILWIPANVIQGMAAGIVFRKLNLDPRLKKAKDYFFFILVGGILANIPGAFYGPYIGKLFGLFTDQSYPVAVAAWLIGNGTCAIVFGIILLKALSPIVIKTRAFCKGLIA
ncbi:MAG: hypothetical protein J7L42_05480 [Elusimicrobia bacterium]|nr:hypothetical protein [Elusimicrobiota bacterium]